VTSVRPAKIRSSWLIPIFNSSNDNTAPSYVKEMEWNFFSEVGELTSYLYTKQRRTKFVLINKLNRNHLTSKRSENSLSTPTIDLRSKFTLLRKIGTILETRRTWTERISFVFSLTDHTKQISRCNIFLQLQNIVIATDVEYHSLAFRN